MGLTQYRLPYSRQPDGPVAPNADLLGADVALWSAHAPRVLFGYAGGSADADRSAAHGVGALGRYGAWSRSANAGADFGIWQVVPETADGYTVAVVAAPVSSANRKVSISQRSAASNAPQIALLFNTNASFSSSAGAVTLYGRNTGATNFAITCNTGVDGSLHCWVGGNSAASGYLYRDGIAQSLATSQRVSGTYSTTAQKLRVGNTADYTTDGLYVCDDPVYLCLMWPRMLPEDLAREISARLLRNLGEAFEPRRIWVPVSAASGPPTLAAIAASNLTASGARLTVT